MIEKICGNHTDECQCVLFDNFRCIQTETALSDATDLLHAVQFERNLIICHRALLALSRAMLNITGNNTNGNPRAFSALFEEDIVLSNSILNSNATGEELNVTLQRESRNADGNLNDTIKAWDNTSLHNITTTGHHTDPFTEEVKEFNISAPSQYNSSLSTIRLETSTEPMKGKHPYYPFEIQFMIKYLSIQTLSKAVADTDTSVAKVKTSAHFYSGWPRFELGNPFLILRNQAKFENISDESLWENYSKETETLKDSPLFKGIHKQVQLDSGHAQMLLYLRHALMYIQDKTGHIILSYISNHSASSHVDLIKTTSALLQQSLSIFNALSAPMLPCKYKTFADYEPSYLNTPQNVHELYMSISYHTTFAMNLHECEIDLGNTVVEESEEYINKLYQKITIDLLLIMTALLIVPTILYSFTKVSKWITVYVSQLEERNMALAEKTAELDKEKSLTENLLYEVSKFVAKYSSKF